MPGTRIQPLCFKKEVCGKESHPRTPKNQAEADFLNHTFPAFTPSFPHSLTVTFSRTLLNESLTQEPPHHTLLPRNSPWDDHLLLFLLPLLELNEFCPYGSEHLLLYSGSCAALSSRGTCAVSNTFCLGSFLSGLSYAQTSPILENKPSFNLFVFLDVLPLLSLVFRNKMSALNCWSL